MKIELKAAGYYRNDLTALDYSICRRCGDTVVFAKTRDGYTKCLDVKIEENDKGKFYNKHTCKGK